MICQTKLGQSSWRLSPVTTRRVISYHLIALRVPPGLYRAQIALPARPSRLSQPAQPASLKHAQSTQRTVAVLPAGYESLLSVDGRPPQAEQARPGFAETQGSDIGWWLLVAAALLLLLEQQVASAAGRRYVS